MGSDEADDRALLEGCLRSDASAWERLVRRYAGLVRWAIVRALGTTPLAGDDHAASEIFQDVFRRILEPGRLRALREAAHLKKYLCVIAAREAISHVRRVVRERRLGPIPVSGDGPSGADTPIEPADGSEDPSKRAQEKECREILDALVAGLGGRERACFELCYLEGFTHERIARVLGMKTDTVSTVLRRLREKLRDRLRERGIEDVR